MLITSALYQNKRAMHQRQIIVAMIGRTLIHIFCRSKQAKCDICITRSGMKTRILYLSSLINKYPHVSLTRMIEYCFYQEMYFSHDSTNTVLSYHSEYNRT